MRRFRPSHTTVVAYLALFVALGSGAYAAFHLPRNSVRSPNIVNGQVRAPDLARPQAIRSAHLPKTKYPNPGCSTVVNQWASLTHVFLEGRFDPVGYYRDVDGIVHLTGAAMNCGGGQTIFTLAEGYRPINNQTEVVTNPYGSTSTVASVSALPDGRVFVTSGSGPGDQLVLAGITFRCAPLGVHGCP